MKGFVVFPNRLPVTLYNQTSMGYISWKTCCYWMHLVNRKVLFVTVTWHHCKKNR